MSDDKARWGGEKTWNLPQYKIMKWKRRCEKWKNNKLVYIMVWSVYRRIQIRYNVDIPAQTRIGAGFKIEHIGGIVINPSVVIGKNCNIYNGVTLGKEKRGSRVGNPVIGDEVWIGANSVIVGAVHIGNDVMIAPGAFVNFDVPDHSIVLGNPAKIIHRDNATEAYIKDKI